MANPVAEPSSDDGPGAALRADRLEAEVAELRRCVAQLQRELADVRRATTGSLAAPVADLPPNPAAATPHRRELLRHAGVAAAGAVAGTTALGLAQASPAAAVNGDAVTCGQMKTASFSTELRYNGAAMSSTHILAVHDSGGADTFFPAAVGGVATADVDHGVLGQTGVVGGSGVVGLSVEETAVGGTFLAGMNFGFGAVIGKANLRLPAFGPTPRLRNAHGSYYSGDIVSDENSDLWLCVAGAATGGLATWRKLGGLATTGQLHLHTAPKRLYDSRPGNPPLGGTKGQLANGGIRQIDGNVVIGGAPVVIPPTATAALVNVTVVNTSANGFLALYDGALPAWPGNSTLNWFLPGSVVGNMAVVKTTNSKIKAFVSGNASTDFLLDVAGWYE